jgi:tetratricopeptide (TPR) repeat protein
MVKKKQISKKIPTKVNENPPVQKAFRGFHFKSSLLLSLFAFLLYANTLQHQFAFDDSIVIVENQFTKKGMAGIKDLATKDFFTGIYGEQGMELTGGRYRPLSLVIFAIENQLFGEAAAPLPGQAQTYKYNPFIGHLFNLLFYALSVWLMYQLLLLWFPKFKIGAFITTLLFVVHPIHSEVVANIKSRDEILALFFVLVALYFLHQWITSRNIMGLLISCISFFLACLAKENAFTFVVIIPLIVYLIYQKNPTEALKISAPIILCAALYILLRSSMVGLPSTTETNTSVLENPFVNSDFSTKMATIFSILLRYVGLLIWPNTLRSDYSFAHIPFVGWGNWEALLGLVVYLGMGFLLVRGLLKKQPSIVGIAIYLFPLSLASNIVFNIGAPMGERFVYMASFGFILWLVYMLCEKFKLKTVSDLKKTSVALPLAIVALLGSYKTFDRNADWYNNDSLFAADVKTTPKSAKMQYYYANSLLKKQLELGAPEGPNPELQESLIHFKKSIEIYPDFQLSWYNVGLVYVQMADGKNALPYVQQSLQMTPNDPKALALLGQVYGRYLNQPEKGIAPLRKSIELFGNREHGIIQNLAICYAMSGKRDSALYYFNECLQLDPNNGQTYQNMGGLLMELGRTEEAQKYFDKAKQLTN